MTLYAFGSDPSKIDSRSAVASTSDGTNWTALAPSFVEPGFNTTTATNGINWVTTSSFGQIAITDDLTNWTAYDPEDKNWLITRLQYGNGNFVCVGHEKNANTLVETAFVATSGNGVEATFTRTWISRGLPSTLFDLTFATGSTWFAVGSTTDLTTPILLSSTNGAQHWDTNTIPTSIGPLYSVAYNSATSRIWVGGKGKIATGIWDGDQTQWVINDSLTDNRKNKPILKIFSCVISGVTLIIALAGSTIWYSTNSVDWQSVSKVGYTFADVAYYNSKLIFSVWGPLLQYTGFTAVWTPTSPAMTLVGYNNKVQAYSLVAI